MSPSSPLSCNLHTGLLLSWLRSAQRHPSPAGCSSAAPQTTLSARRAEALVLTSTSSIDL